MSIRTLISHKNFFHAKALDSVVKLSLQSKGLLRCVYKIDQLKKWKVSIMSLFIENNDVDDDDDGDDDCTCSLKNFPHRK